MREIQSVACLAEHPNVVKYFRSWQQDSHFYIQMELCEAGNLRTLLDSLSEPLLESQVWMYIEQVAAGLDHIHNHGVLHLDIKPENIFVDGKGSSTSTEFCDSDFFSDS
jgi:membrane-associated tyrosine/threonine-specific cdc2-inhibitory kinase